MVAAGASALPGVADAAPPDAFYTHPALPADAPLGSILRIEPMTAPAITGKVTGTRGYRLLYVTTGARGGRDAASASFFVPPQPPTAGPRALVAAGISDESMGAHCRPTTTLVRHSPLDQALGTAPIGTTVTALRAGHAVVVPDLGNDGAAAPAPTLVPRFDGHATLDAIRAALQVPGTGLTGASTVGIFGPSGGGSQGAAVAAEQAAGYAPELRIPAVMIGQMVPDHRNFVRSNDGGFGSGFAFADLLGLEVGHPEMRIDDKLTDTGRRIAQIYRTGCAMPTYATLGGVALGALFRPGHSPADDPDFQAAFRAAALATPTSPTPTAALRLTRCDSNLSPTSVTPVGDLARAAQTYRAAGADVSTRVVSCLGATDDVYAPDLQWLLSRL